MDDKVNREAQMKLERAIANVNPGIMSQAIAEGADITLFSQWPTSMHKSLLRILMDAIMAVEEPNEGLIGRFGECFDLLLSGTDLYHHRVSDVPLLTHLIREDAPDFMFKKLLPHVDLTQRKDGFKTSFGYALTIEHTRSLELMMKQCGFDQLPPEKIRALFGNDKGIFLALRNNDAEMFRRLLPAYKVNEMDTLTDFKLVRYILCETERKTALMNVLLEDPRFDVLAKENGATPLEIAQQYGADKNVIELIQSAIEKKALNECVPTSKPKKNRVQHTRL